jgi:hypothetical protein
VSHRAPRLPVALAAGAVAALAAAAPAMASEDPTSNVPPPPWALAPVTALPVPLPHAVAPSRPVIRRARIVPHRIRAGRRATLRLSLSTPGRLVIAITRVSRPNRGAVATRRVAVAGGTVALRLPKRFHGRKLAAGRYRVTVVAVSASGTRSRPVRRSLVVRAARA